VAEAIASAVGESLDIGFRLNARGASISRAQSASGSGSVNATVNCEVSGDVDVTGTANFSGSQTSVSGNFDVKQVFNDCTTKTKDGDDIALDGTLESDGDVDISFTNNSVSGSITQNTTGSLDVSGDNIKSGTCGISTNSTATISSSSVTVKTTGSICGRSINSTFSANIS